MLVYGKGLSGADRVKSGWGECSAAVLVTHQNDVLAGFWKHASAD